MQIKEEFESIGNLNGFYQEYMNIAQSPDNAPFKPEWMKLHHYDFEIRNNQPCLIGKIKEDEKIIPIEVYCGVDPASSLSARADYFVIATIGIDYEGNMAISGSYSPSDLNLKENIVDASTNSLISDFQKVRFVNFNMIDDKKKLKKLGVISQEIKEIYPTAVVEKNVRDDDDNITGTRQYVKYDVLYLKSCLLANTGFLANTSGPICTAKSALITG